MAFGRGSRARQTQAPKHIPRTDEIPTRNVDNTTLMGAPVKQLVKTQPGPKLAATPEPAPAPSPAPITSSAPTYYTPIERAFLRLTQKRNRHADQVRKENSGWEKSRAGDLEVGETCVFQGRPCKRVRRGWTMTHEDPAFRVYLIDATDTVYEVKQDDLIRVELKAFKSAAA